VQLVPTQASIGHVTGEPHSPIVSQVTICVSPEQFVEPGLHTPVQAVPTQAWPEQFTGLPHWPVASHVRRPLPEHCFAPGVQTPPQLVPTHTYWHVRVML
jgi:hypothetical protein